MRKPHAGHYASAQGSSGCKGSRHGRPLETTPRDLGSLLAFTHLVRSAGRALYLPGTHAADTAADFSTRLMRSKVQIGNEFANSKLYCSAAILIGPYNDP
jgi:hypothetical protein